MTGTMVNGGNDEESLSLMFARMQMELSQSSKNSASANIKEIQRMQEEQTQAGNFLNQARQIRTTVQSTRKGMPMPDTMKYYMDTKKIPCPQAKQGNLYSDDEWGRIVMNLETYLEKVAQSTLSRDLKFMKVAKIPHKEKGYIYIIPENANEQREEKISSIITDQ